MKIKNNCKKATFLIEKRISGRISFPEKVELKMHLAGCTGCRLYQHQSRYIKKLVTSFLGEISHKKIVLHETFKASMEIVISNKIENSGDINIP